MTPEQRATLAAALCASTNPDLQAAVAARNDTEIARLANLPSTFVVWRSTMPVSDYRNAMVWTEVDTLTAGAARIFTWLSGNLTLPLESGKAAVRQGIADAFGSNTTTRTNLLAVAKRFATQAERVFATGTGTTAAPGDLGWEGSVTIEDVGRALNDNPCA